MTGTWSRSPTHVPPAPQLLTVREREREGERGGGRERGEREREAVFFGYVALVGRRWYAHGPVDHVPVVEDLAQVDAKINNLAAVVHPRKGFSFKKRYYTLLYLQY